MFYFIALIITLVLLFGLSQFIKFPSIREPLFHFFIQQLSVITISISLFAIYITGGKTLFITFLFWFLFLISKRQLIFTIPLKKDFNHGLRYILLIIPIIVIQFLLHFDISALIPKLPSDDILLYSGFANSLVQFGNENRYEVLNVLYPQLFSGISPYHFYEIWFTSLIGSTSGLGYAYILLFVVSPYLVWLFILGILSIMEHLSIQLNIKHYLFAFLLLFIGPVYLTIYEFVFHDGDFFQSTVFTITGFVKQTLPFSYYGQKHLPVYIFSILSFLFFLKENYKLSIVTGMFIAVCSFGPTLGVFGAFGLLFLTQKKIRTKVNFLLISSISITLFSIIIVLKMGINTEISERTFYFHDFLKYLNFKGEILRIVSKIVAPVVWFSILYSPFILLILLYRKYILSHSGLKLLLLFLGFSFGIGVLSISFVQGMNSDQFLTNLLPIFNVIVIIILIHLLTTKPKNKILQYGILSVAIINGVFLVNFHQKMSIAIEEHYSSDTIIRVTNQLKKEKTNPIIAYILPDKIVNDFAPLIWYPYKPGKAFLLENYYNLVNINYPYTKYERNSASIAFSAENQMRFFLKEKIVPKDQFGLYQKDFLKQNSIRWLFCAKGVELSTQLESMVEKKYMDKLSGEVYCRLKN